MHDMNKELALWASQVTPKHPKNKTLDCSVEIRNAIKQYLELRAAGKTDASLASFHEEFLVPKLGYKQSRFSLTRYIQKYETVLWEKINGRHRE